MIIEVFVWYNYDLQLIQFQGPYITIRHILVYKSLETPGAMPFMYSVIASVSEHC